MTVFINSYLTQVHLQHSYSCKTITKSIKPHVKQLQKASSHIILRIIKHQVIYYTCQRYIIVVSLPNTKVFYQKTTVLQGTDKV